MVLCISRLLGIAKNKTYVCRFYGFTQQMCLNFINAMSFEGIVTRA